MLRRSRALPSPEMPHCAKLTLTPGDVVTGGGAGGDAVMWEPVVVLNIGVPVKKGFIVVVDGFDEVTNGFEVDCVTEIIIIFY